jgi:arylsulfatase A-like enzyme
LWGIDPDSLKGRLPCFIPDVPEVRSDFADYMGEIQALDAGIGVIVEELKAAGEFDNTILVLSGDHGMPGVPGGKCNLYDFGTAVPLIVRGPGIKPGRVVDDYVNLMDLAPTFLEVGHVKAPKEMTGRSFLSLLQSKRSGQVDRSRTWVITGRERHVADARDGRLPYPHRALRTQDFLYIRNFAPDRWPMGRPGFEPGEAAPTAEALEQNTYAAFSDMDASPTKAWLVGQHDTPEWQWHYQFAFGKRPAEELYNLRLDPEQTRNLAADKTYEKTLKKLSKQLMKVLQQTGDPRVTGDGGAFDRAPFTDPNPAAGKARRQEG